MSSLDVDEAKAEAWFGSLVEFVALRELRMPVRNLLDSTDGGEPSVPLCDLLPSSIKTLVLAKVDFSEYSMLDRQLRRLLSVQQNQFPSLRKLMLLPFQMELIEEKGPFSSYKITERTEVAFAETRRLYKEQGLEFGFIINGDFDIVDADGDVVLETDDIDSITYRDPEIVRSTLS